MQLLINIIKKILSKLSILYYAAVSSALIRKICIYPICYSLKVQNVNGQKKYKIFNAVYDQCKDKLQQLFFIRLNYKFFIDSSLN